MTFVKPNAKQLTEVSELIDAGKLKVVVHKVWPLEEAGYETATLTLPLVMALNFTGPIRGLQTGLQEIQR